MAGTFTAVDLSRLPFPGVVETLDFEQIFESVKADLIALDPGYTALLESDPAMKVLQAVSYLSLHHRNRVNEAAKAVMLAYAEDTDLDQIAANYGVQRLLITPEDPNTTPPTPAVYEEDPALRRRVQLSPEGYAAAGPGAAYIFHTLSADGMVLDASWSRPVPGTVAIAVLSREDDGTPTLDLLDKVSSALNAERIRPLNDTVAVGPAVIVEYAIEATLQFYSGPDPAVVMQVAQEAIEAYTQESHRLGRGVTISGIHAALHQEGVHDVILTNPAANVDADWNEAVYCTGIELIQGTVIDG